MTIQEIAEQIYDEWPQATPLDRDNMIHWLVCLITEGLAG